MFLSDLMGTKNDIGGGAMSEESVDQGEVYFSASEEPSVGENEDGL